MKYLAFILIALMGVVAGCAIEAKKPIATTPQSSTCCCGPCKCNTPINRNVGLINVDRHDQK